MRFNKTFQFAVQNASLLVEIAGFVLVVAGLVIFNQVCWLLVLLGIALLSIDLMGFPWMEEGSDAGYAIDHGEPSTTIEMPVEIDTLACDLVKADFRGDVVLFFDIDGVLHPHQTETLEFKDRLLALLYQYPNLELVMCSNWRETASQSWFEDRLGNPLADHFKGCTPRLYGRVNRRQHEIDEFCRMFRVKRYAVVDDRADLYPVGYPNLVLTDPSEGLTDETIRELIEILA